jgi:hypothetical protein
MQYPIRRPFLERRNLNAQPMKAGRACSGTWPNNTFVYLNGSGLLLPVATAGVSLYGWSHGPSTLTTDVPPVGLPQPGVCFPFDASGSVFVLSVTDAAVDTATTGTPASAPALSAVTIGGQYGIIVPTAGTLTGIQMLNISDTTNKLFTVIDVYPNQASTDLNPLVLCQVISTCLQA